MRQGPTQAAVLRRPLDGGGRTSDVMGTITSRQVPALEGPFNLPAMALSAAFGVVRPIRLPFHPKDADDGPAEQHNREGGPTPDHWGRETLKERAVFALAICHRSHRPTLRP